MGIVLLPMAAPLAKGLAELGVAKTIPLMAAAASSSFFMFQSFYVPLSQAHLELAELPERHLRSPHYTVLRGGLRSWLFRK
jgi:hypothetical protein